MKTKKEIYVVVDTPKKAKKLQKILDMFGEKPNEQAKENGNVWRNTYFYFENKGTYDTAIYEKGCHTKGKTKVSIKELKNILAVEYLKEGDVVVTKQGNEKVIGLVNKVCTSGLSLFEVKKWVRVSDGFLWDNKGCFDNFIRYATDEERSLLEPKEEKKELEVGKWYNVGFEDMDEFFALINITGIVGDRVYFYGFDGDKWYNKDWFRKDLNWAEATAEEVKQSLIQEAEKRYKVGDKVSKIHDDYSEGLRVFNNNFHYKESNNTLYMEDIAKEGYPQDSCIFKDGKWAEVLPQLGKTITDQDISTLERLHDTIHDVHGYSLEFELMKSARVLAEKLRELKDNPHTFSISGKEIQLVLDRQNKR